jgi:hypothetical protein
MSSGVIAVIRRRPRSEEAGAAAAASGRDRASARSRVPIATLASKSASHRASYRAERESWAKAAARRARRASAEGLAGGALRSTSSASMVRNRGFAATITQTAYLPFGSS